MGVVSSTLNLAVNPAAAITGINQLGITMGGLYSTALKIGAAFAGWKITQATFQSMKTAEGQIIRLQTALQSATKGVNDYRMAMQFAAKTPFPVESVIDASVALRVFRFDPFKETTKGGRQLMEVLGDMAGAMGKDVTEASHALTRAMVGEWEVMQNTFQISARTIPKLAGLRSGTKAYGDAIVEFLTKQDRFRGGMEKTAQSLAGMTSNIRDGIDILFMGIGGVADSMEGSMKGLTLYDSVKDAFKGVYDAVSASNDVLDENGKIIQKGVSQGEKIMRLGQGIGQAFKLAFDMVIRPFFDFFAKGIEKVLNASEKFYGKFFNNTKSTLGLARKEVKTFQELSKLYLAKTPADIAKAIGIASTHTQAFLKKVGITAKSTSEEVNTALRASFLESKSGIEKGFMIFVIMMAIIGEVLKQQAKKIVDYMQPITDSMIGLSETVATSSMHRVEEMWDFVKGFMSGISGYVDHMRDSLSAAITQFDAIMIQIDNILSVIFGANESVGESVGTLAGMIGGVLVGALNTVLGLVRAILGIFETIAGVVQMIVSAVGTVTSAIGEKFSMLIGDKEGEEKSRAKKNSRAASAQAGLDTAIGGVKNIGGGAYDAMQGTMNIVGGAFGSKDSAANMRKEAEATLFNQKARNNENASKRYAANTKGGRGTVNDLSYIPAGISNRRYEYNDRELAKMGPAVTAPDSVAEILKENIKKEDEDSKKQLYLDNKRNEKLEKPLIGIEKVLTKTFNVTAVTSQDTVDTFNPLTHTLRNGVVVPRFDIGEWNVSRDQVARIHRGEMIIPAQDSERIRSLFGGGDGSGNMKGKGSLLVNKMAQGSAGKPYMDGLGGSGGGGAGGSYRNITIHQNFYGKAGVGTASTNMKSSARDLAAKMDLL